MKLHTVRNIKVKRTALISIIDIAQMFFAALYFQCFLLLWLDWLVIVFQKEIQLFFWLHMIRKEMNVEWLSKLEVILLSTNINISQGWRRVWLVLKDHLQDYMMLCVLRNAQQKWKRLFARQIVKFQHVQHHLLPHKRLSNYVFHLMTLLKLS